jgi:hypothetical protein
VHFLPSALGLEFAHQDVYNQVGHELVPKPAGVHLVSHKQLHEARLVPWRDVDTLRRLAPAVQLAQLTAGEARELVWVAHVVWTAAKGQIDQTVCAFARVDREGRGVQFCHLLFAWGLVAATVWLAW